MAEASAALKPYGYKAWSARLVIVRGELERHQGDYGQARMFYEEGLAGYREIGDRLGTATVLHNLGHVALRQGDQRQAAELFKQALALHQEGDNDRGVALSLCLAGLGGVAAASAEANAEWTRVARLLGAAAAGLETAERGISPVDQAEFDHYQGAARAALEPAAFDAAWAEGQAMTLEQAVAYALEDTPAPMPSAT